MPTRRGPVSIVRSLVRKLRKAEERIKTLESENSKLRKALESIE